MTLDLLRSLNALDNQIDTERERISTIEAQVRDRSDYESAQRRHQQATAPVRQLEAEQRDLDLKLGTAKNLLGEVEGKLYGGRVGNSRELEDLQKRGADIRRQIDVAEEQFLNVMEQLETATSGAAEAEATLKQVVADRRTHETNLIAERKALGASVKIAQTERDRTRAQLDAANLRLYDRLRLTRGQAVAEVKQRTCLGCRVSLTAAYEQRLRHGDVLVTCQSCGRILYLAN